MFRISICTGLKACFPFHLHTFSHRPWSSIQKNIWYIHGTLISNERLLRDTGSMYEEPPMKTNQREVFRFAAASACTKRIRRFLYKKNKEFPQPTRSIAIDGQSLFRNIRGSGWTYYISNGAKPSMLYSQFPPCSSLASQS